MVLPAGFSEWEHLQDKVRNYHNKAVRLYFKNQPDDDISTPKSSLKHSCLIKDNDTVAMTQLRLWLFEVTVGRLEATLPTIVGMPLQEFQRDRKFKPQVKLVFRKDFNPVEDTEGYQPHESEITFRLMDQSSDTISRLDAERLATRIKAEFTTPLLTWEKGIYKSTYEDINNGYDLRIYTQTQLESERLIKKVLSIQGHIFSNEFYQFITHEKSFPANPGTHRVYGQLRKKPVRRPRVTVKFRHAQLVIYGRQKPVNLVAAGSRLKSVIERV